MPVNYDAFREASWPDRLSLFNSLLPEERAALVREHIGRWLATHREELSAEQIDFLNGCIAAVTPELYSAVRNPEAQRRVKEIEHRAASLLSREQMGEALTLHWGTSPRREHR